MSELIQEVKIKICKRCSAEFSGIRCNACVKVLNDARHAANPDRGKIQGAAWRAENLDRARAASAAWHAANREKANAARSAWAAANPEKSRATKAALYAANSEKIKAANAAWNAANTDKRRAISQNRRARKLGNGGKLSPGLREKLFRLQKGRCACCKNPLGDDYHMDHIIPLANGGSNTDGNIQLLTSTCNQKKGTKDPVEFMQSRGFLL